MHPENDRASMKAALARWVEPDMLPYPLWRPIMRGTLFLMSRTRWEWPHKLWRRL